MLGLLDFRGLTAEKAHLSVSVLSSPASNFQKLVAIKLYISELKYNLDVFTVQMLDEDWDNEEIYLLFMWQEYKNENNKVWYWQDFSNFLQDCLVL